MATPEFGYRTQAETDALLEEEKRQKEKAEKNAIVGEAQDYLQKWGTDYLTKDWGSWFPGVTDSTTAALTFDSTPLFTGAQAAQAAPTYGFSAAANTAPLTLGGEAASMTLGSGSLFGPGAFSTAGGGGFSLGGGLAGGGATAAGGTGAGAAGSLTFDTTGLDFASALGQQGAGTGASAAGTGASTAGQSTGVTAGQVAGALATAYSAYVIGSNLMANRKAGMQNTLAGAQIGTYILPGLGTIIGGLIGLGLGQIGGTTDEGTLRRRQARKELGAKTPLGERLEFMTTKGLVSINDISYELSQEVQNDPVGAAARAWVGALAFTLMGENKLGTDFQNMFANAVYAAGDIDATRKNVLSLYRKVGIQPGQIIAAVRELQRKGIITEGQAKVYVSAVDGLRPGRWTPQQREHTLQSAKNVTPAANQPQQAAPAQTQPAPAQPTAKVGPAPAPPSVKPRTLKQAAELLQQRQQAQQPPQQQPQRAA